MPARTALILVCGLLVAACGAAENAPAPAHQPDPVQLVEKLGSEAYDERQVAYARLRDLGLAAGPALRARRDDPDLEVQTRVRALLDTPYLDEAQVAFYEFLRTEIGPVMGAKSFGPGALKQDACEGKSFDPAPAKDENGEEIAVDPTLQWLARNQEADGHWDSLKFGAQCEADLEQTAMVLLCILATGHTERVGKYKENVRRAVDWLGARLNDEGSFLDGKGRPVVCHAQALAVCVLSESISMTHKPERYPAAQKALARMVACQSLRDGQRDGWGRAPQSAKPDIFTTCWAVLALRSAKVSGRDELRVSPEVWEGALRFLDRIDDRAAHAYRHAEGAAVSPQATVLGVLARYMASGQGDEAARLAYLQPAFASMARAMEAGENREALMLIPITLAAFNCVDLWMKFHEEKTRQLMPTRANAAAGSGSWAPAGVWSGMGRVGSTACCYYPFTVYWRGYRPISR